MSGPNPTISDLIIRNYLKRLVRLLIQELISRRSDPSFLAFSLPASDAVLLQSCKTFPSDVTSVTSRKTESQVEWWLLLLNIHNV